MPHQQVQKPKLRPLPTGRFDPFLDIPMSLPVPQLQTLFHETDRQGQLEAGVPKTMLNQEGHARLIRAA